MFCIRNNHFGINGSFGKIVSPHELVQNLLRFYFRVSQVIFMANDWVKLIFSNVNWNWCYTPWRAPHLIYGLLDGEKEFQRHGTFRLFANGWMKMMKIQRTRIASPMSIFARRNPNVKWAWFFSHHIHFEWNILFYSENWPLFLECSENTNNHQPAYELLTSVYIV